MDGWLGQVAGAILHLLPGLDRLLLLLLLTVIVVVVAASHLESLHTKKRKILCSIYGRDGGG